MDDEIGADLYPHIMAYVRETPWAITAAYLLLIKDVMAFRAAGNRLTEDELRARLAGARIGGAHDSNMAAHGDAGQSGSVAVLPLIGIIAHRIGTAGDISTEGTSVQGFTKRFRDAVADAGVGSIVIDVDSPGGAVDGVPELADEIFNARGTKPIVAVANTFAASAAYWLAVQADELVVTPSGEVGSIGVFGMHEDISEALAMKGVRTTLISAGKFKTEGNPFEPLTEEARDAMQAAVDGFHDMFVKAVARGRGVKPGEVRKGFAEGRTVLAREAIDEGMADRVATLDQTVARLRGKPRRAAASAARHRYRFL